MDSRSDRAYLITKYEFPSNDVPKRGRHVVLSEWIPITLRLRNSSYAGSGPYCPYVLLVFTFPQTRPNTTLLQARELLQAIGQTNPGRR